MIKMVIGRLSTGSISEWKETLTTTGWNINGFYLPTHARGRNHKDVYFSYYLNIKVVKQQFQERRVRKTIALRFISHIYNLLFNPMFSITEFVTDILCGPPPIVILLQLRFRCI